MELAWSIAVMAGLLAAIAMLAWTVRRQAAALENLALRKPYWLVEIDESGVRNIAALEGRVDAVERSQAQPSATEAPVALMDGRPLPSMMDPDDQVADLGERHA